MKIADMKVHMLQEPCISVKVINGKTVCSITVECTPLKCAKESVT